MRLGGVIKTVVVDKINQTLTQRLDYGNVIWKTYFTTAVVSVTSENWKDYVVPTGKLWVVKHARADIWSNDGANPSGNIQVAIQGNNGTNTFNFVRIITKTTPNHEIITDKLQTQFVLTQGQKLTFYWIVSTSTPVNITVYTEAQIYEYDITA